MPNVDRDPVQIGQRAGGDDVRISVQELQRALATRDLIGQAKGLIRGHTGCGDETAFQLLIQLSRACNYTLPDVAETLLAAAGSRGGLPGEFAQAYDRRLDLIREKGTFDRTDLSTSSRGPGRALR